MAMVSRASVVWEGDLVSGKGTVSAGSRAFQSLPVSWAARTEAANGKTSPEELVASAHAACFAMAFSAGLARAKTPPSRLEVSCAVTFDKVEAGWRVASSALEVKGTVPGLDQAGFEAAAQAAKDGCPISQALKGNVQLGVKATLAR
ncbi:MAG TPA: OsmC family peroxiredoxin [Anaeromyxobacteraceae bacterium]|jgi:osmotically inducible protein OsmC